MTGTVTIRTTTERYTPQRGQKWFFADLFTEICKESANNQVSLLTPCTYTHNHVHTWNKRTIKVYICVGTLTSFESFEIRTLC